MARQEKMTGAEMPGLISFKIGEASPANTFLAIWVAKAAGLYEANGLDLEIVPVVGGRESGPDLSSGRIHLMHIGLSSVVRANQAGFDLVAVGSLSNIIRNTMFTAPHVKSPADLKGGVVGISSAGSETDPLTTLALKRLGLARDDVSVKEIGVSRLAAVRDGTVSASLMGEPYRSQALALGLNPIVDFLAERTPWLYSGLVVHRPALAGNRDLLLRFLRGTVEGNYLAVKDAARAKAVIAAELAVTDPAIVETTYVNFRNETPLDAELTRESAQNVIDTVATTGSRRVEDYIDTSLHDALGAEGFFRAMQNKYGKR
jgi:ABC-type nitrate/sulfonate/bicarbonate transport system substrate-binding protein